MRQEKQEENQRSTLTSVSVPCPSSSSLCTTSLHRSSLFHNFPTSFHDILFKAYSDNFFIPVFQRCLQHLQKALDPSFLWPLYNQNLNTPSISLSDFATLSFNDNELRRKLQSAKIYFITISTVSM